MSDETLDEVWNDYNRDDYDAPRMVECLICGEWYLSDEGCCLLDS